MAAPHGLDGSFHVAAAVPQLLTLGATVTVRGAVRKITRRAGHDRGVIVRVDGCDDRDAAKALRGESLMVPRERAPALQADEWWATDLEGCAVRDGELHVGVVTRLLALPSCEVLAVERAGGGELLVPLVGDAVRTVDVQARTIDVDLAFLGEQG